MQQPRRLGAFFVPRRAVHDRCGVDTAASASGRSENVGYSTGSPSAFPEATYSGASGWENRFELSIRCPYEGMRRNEVGRYALLTEGRRSNRTLISFVMRLRFAMTARTRSTLDCTGDERGCLQRPVSGVEGAPDRRAAMLVATLAVPFDGQHVVKRFFILPAPALI